MRDRKLILLVEDYEGFRTSLKQLLELENYDVLEAETGEAAIDSAEREHPDLILMDLTLPGIDGIGATKKIREIPGLQSVPMIALSAFDAYDFRDDAIAAGCNDYLTKPVDFEQLTEMVAKYLP